MKHDTISSVRIAGARGAHVCDGGALGDQITNAMVGTRYATKHLAVVKRDGTRYDIQFPGTLELAHGPMGLEARYDLGRGSAVAYGTAHHADDTVTVENDEARYVWSLA